MTALARVYRTLAAALDDRRLVFASARLGARNWIIATRNSIRRMASIEEVLATVVERAQEATVLVLVENGEAARLLVVHEGRRRWFRENDDATLDAYVPEGETVADVAAAEMLAAAVEAATGGNDSAAACGG